MLNRILIILIIQVPPLDAFPQPRQSDQRLEITEAFFNDVKSARLTNAEIIRRYLIPGAYFKDDSVKRVADELLDRMRASFQRPKSDDVKFLKYSVNENEFAVTDMKPLNAPSEPVMLKFTLANKQKEKSRAVDIGDVYAVTLHYLIERQSPLGPVYIKQNTEYFFLFDRENKFISIFAYMIGNYVTFLAF